MTEAQALRQQLEQYKDKYARLLQAVGEKGYWIITDNSKRMHLIKKEEMEDGSVRGSAQ